MHSLLASHQHVLAVLLQVVRSLASLAVMVAIFAPLEHFFAVSPAKLFHKGWSTNLGWYFLNGLVTVFVLGPPTAAIAWAVHALLPPVVTSATAGLSFWPRTAAAMVVGEIGFYWGHRLSHQIPWLWRFHAVHHSATHVNFLINTRAHPVDIVFTRLCGLVLLYATGLTSTEDHNAALIPAIVLFGGSLWSFFIHANLRVRLGPIEQLIATPAFHHWHHTLEDHKDRNYASMLPFMDRVFGTFYLPRTWPTAYGTSTPMPHDLTGQLLEPFAPAREQPRPTAADTPTPI